MFGLNKKVFTGLFTCLSNGSNDTKCISCIQKFMIQPTLIKLHLKESSQEFHYYPFAVKLDRCFGSFNTLNDLSNKSYVPNITEDSNISFFNMIIGINDSETLTRHHSCEFKCRFNGKQCNSNQWWNNDKS